MRALKKLAISSHRTGYSSNLGLRMALEEGMSMDEVASKNDIF